MPVQPLIDLHPHVQSLQEAVLEGLGSSPKVIAPKYFYDQTGSELFEKITALPEYYPTRTEIGILEEHAGEIRDLLGDGGLLIEYGAGASRKIRVLLDNLSHLAAFVPIDISGEHLEESCRQLEQDYPELLIAPVCADYSRHLDLPLPEGTEEAHRIVFFPGSTIGNMHPEEAVEFLQHAADVAGPAGGMLLGVDLAKEPAVLNAAYNDAAGVTARFNKNLLTRINRELEGDFDPRQFAHKAFFNEEESRIEMHLESLQEQQVSVAGQRFSFAAGELLHTENSYKYSLEAFQDLAQDAGFEPCQVWTDPEQLFSVHYMKVAG